MDLEIVKYGEIRKWADTYCAMCNETVGDEEEVIANMDLIPHPWICSSCAKVLSEIIDVFLNKR